MSKNILINFAYASPTQRALCRYEFRGRCSHAAGQISHFIFWKWIWIIFSKTTAILFQFQCIDKSLFLFSSTFYFTSSIILLLLVSSSMSSMPSSSSMSMEPMHNACQCATRFWAEKMPTRHIKVVHANKELFFIASLHHRHTHTQTKTYTYSIYIFIVTIPIQVTGDQQTNVCATVAIALHCDIFAS